jgi:pimeloyl-ACP methyl ester carboxylesterase
MTKPGVVVFVHGILGNASTWSALLQYLQEDPYITRFFDLELFTYTSPVAQFNPLKRIPDFRDLAGALATSLRTEDRLKNHRCVVLVGHSQGGLIIQHLIVDAVKSGHAMDLARIRGVVTLATPNGGSELLLSARRTLGLLWGHPQEKRLRPFDDQIADMHSVLLERVVYAQRASNASYPIRFDVYTGTEDGIVPAHSARGLFPNASVLPGDHSSIIRPTGPDAGVVKALVGACRRAFGALEPDTNVYRTDILDPEIAADMKAAEALLSKNFLSTQNVSAEDFRHWLANYEETFGLPMRVMLARKDESVEGLLMFHESVADGLIIIDYVACHPKSEGLPFRKLIGQVRARAAAVGIPSVIFELEDPSTITETKLKNRARARVRKFQEHGARTIGGLRYLAPNMDSFGKGGEAPFLLMHVGSGRQPTTLPRLRVQEIVNFIYTVWYRNWFSRRFAGRESELNAYVADLYHRVAGEAVELPDRHPLTEVIVGNEGQ